MNISGTGPVIRKALLDSIALPFFILFTTMIGFGTLARGAGFSPEMAWISTLLIWGLPGQLAMVDLTASGQGLIAIVVACSLANARFLPMVVVFLPWINYGKLGMGRALLASQMLSINSWAVSLKNFPLIERDWRRLYYFAFAASIVFAAVAGTLVGYHGVGIVPDWVVLGFIFTSPLFFALVLSSATDRAIRFSMLFGCLLIPLASEWMPSVDLLVTGVVGGSLGFLLKKQKTS